MYRTFFVVPAGDIEIGIIIYLSGEDECEENLMKKKTFFNALQIPSSSRANKII